MKHTYLFILLLIAYSSVFAQYGGGSGQGINIVIAPSLSLVGNGNGYQGGMNDGQNSLRANSISLISAGGQYTGGSNDGISSGTGNGLSLNSNSMYAGGANDGATGITILGLVLLPGQSAYSGGANDGAGIVLNTATNLSTATMFAGGINDGFHSLSNNSTNLIASGMYAGGGDDGYSSIDKIISLVLPVKWVTFTASKKDKDVLLNWQTANELNVTEFIIERSFDGIQFSKIGIETSAGGTGNNQYQYTDMNPAGVCTGFNCEVIYYRLKQISKDQAFDYSPVRQIRFSGKGISFNIFPNPASDKLTINCSSGGQRIAYNISLYNSIGMLFFSKQNVTSPSYEIPVSKMVSGIYYLKLSTESGTTTTAIFINH